MSRILVVVVLAVLVLTSFFAADLALQNPDLEPATNQSDDRQEAFAEDAAGLVELVPVGLLVIVVGIALAAIRAVGGG